MNPESLHQKFVSIWEQGHRYGLFEGVLLGIAFGLIIAIIYFYARKRLTAP